MSNFYDRREKNKKQNEGKDKKKDRDKTRNSRNTNFTEGSLKTIEEQAAGKKKAKGGGEGENHREHSDDDEGDGEVAGQDFQKGGYVFFRFVKCVTAVVAGGGKGG